MSGWFFASSAFVVTYLLVQAIEDAKTKTVYTVLNNFSIAFVFALYLGKCLVLHTMPSMVVPIFLAIALLTHKLWLRKVMGLGDAKAYAVVVLQSGLFFPYSSSFFVPFPLMVGFFSNLFFVAWIVAKGIVGKKRAKEIFLSHERRAFFPFLLVGYAFSIAILIRMAQGL